MNDNPPTMEVIDNGPQFWFLLKEGDEYYLDIRGQASFVEYNLLVLLTAEEKAAYLTSGHAYIDKLADDLNYRVTYNRTRNIYNEHGARTHQAIMAWIAANPNAIR